MNFWNRLFWFFLLFPTLSFAVIFDFKDLGMRNQAILKTNGALQSVTYINPTVSGFLDLDPGSLKKSFKAEIKLDTRFFDSGNWVRNSELKEKWLKSSDSPEVFLRIDDITRSSDYKLSPGKEISFHGNLQWNWLDKKKFAPVDGKILYLPQSKTTQERLPGNVVRLSLNLKWDRGDFFSEPLPLPRATYSNETTLALELLGTDQPPYQKISPEVEKPKQPK